MRNSVLFTPADNDAFVPAHFTIQSPKTTAFDLETLTRFAVMFGPGEISVMALAKELQATAVLDERAARAEAVKLGLKITGTLGLLNDARQRSWLTDDACLEKTRLLQSNGFRIPKPGANQTFAEYITAIE